MTRNSALTKAALATLFLVLGGAASAVEIGSEFTRAFSGTGIQRIQLIFEVRGADPAEFAVFAQGPSLTAEGVEGALPNPQINLLQDGTLIANNNDWQTDSSASQVQTIAEDLGITLADQDAAMVRSLAAGLYTVVVTDVTGLTGITRVGALNVAALSGGTSAADITAEFTRAFSGTGIERIQLIFEVVGSDTAQYGVFAQGPSLTSEGVEGALPDPQINLLQDGSLIAANNDWQTDPTAPDVQAVAEALNVTLAEQDAAMIRTLGAGLYTVVVTDVDGAVGITRVGALNVEGLTGGGEGDITAGVWRGSATNPDGSVYSICFNVAADGSALTAAGSTCDQGAALVLSYEGLTDQSGAGCSVNLLFQEDISISSVNVFTETVVNVSGIVETIVGAFSDSTTASGNATRSDSGVFCEGDWDATPGP